MAKTLGQLVFDIVVNDDQFVAKLKEAEARLKSLSGSQATAMIVVKESVSEATASLHEFQKVATAKADVLQTLGEAGGDVASTIMSAFKVATAAVATVGTAITVLGAKFEQTINTVSVLSGGSLPELTDAARDFGVQSKFSAQEAADAMVNFAQAGMSAEENIAATGSAIKLAAASGSDLALSTSIMSDAMSQFSLTSENASNLADIFTFALNDSKLGMSDLSVSMRYAGTVGAGLGMSIQETTAALMMFSDIGLKGSKAGTVFRQAMNAAANTTSAADKILKSYGLTQEAISPASHKFGEILKTVADANISVTDAMEIFGTTAGANVVALARIQKQNEGTAKSFEGLARGMQGAIDQGAAATTAAAMMDNVAGQFTLLISRIREIGLSIYDAYSGPLKSIITEAGGVASDIIAVFGYASTSISDGVGGALSDLAAYIKDNRAEIVGMAVAFIEGFSRLTAQILSLMPTFAGLVSIALDFGNAIITVGDAVAALIPGVTNAAGVFATLFLVGEALAFVAAISKIKDAIKLLKIELVGAEMSAAAATGGLTALVMVGGLLIGWLAQYVTANDEAAASVDRLRAAEEHRKLVNDKSYAAEVARVGKLLDASKARAQDALKSGKALSDEERRQAEATLRLTKEQAMLEVQSGRLVAIKGRLATVSEVAAMSAKGESDAVQTMYRDQAKEQVDALDRLHRLRKAKEDADKAFKTPVRGGGVPGAPSQEDMRQGIAQSPGGEQIQSYEELTIAIQDAEKAVKRFEDRDQAFRNELLLVETAVNKTSGSMKRLSSPTRDAAKATDELTKAMRALIEEAQKRYDEVLKSFEEGSVSEGELQAQRLEEQIAADNAKYQAAEVAAAKLNDATADWEKRRNESEKMVRETYRKGLLADSKAFYEKEVAEANNAIWDESERRAAGRKKEIDTILAFYREKLAAAANDAEATKQLLDDRDTALDAAGAKFRAEDIAAEEEYQAKLAEIKKTAAERFGNEVNAIEEAKLSASEKIRKDANDKVKAIIDDGVKAYREANKDREVSDLEAFNYALSLLGMNKEAIAQFLADAEKRANEAMTPFEKFRSIFAKIFGENAGKALDNLKKKFDELAGKGGKIAGFLAKIFKGAFGAIKAGFDTVMSVVETVSGFSFNILGTIQNAVSSIISQQDAAMQDADQRAREAGFDPEAAARRAQASVNPADTATAFVQGLVDNALRITEVFVAAVGPVLSSLAAGLPAVFTAVADALPGIATAFAANIGPIINAIIDGVPKVAIALIEALPVIATALVEAILTDLIPALPGIAFELAKAVVSAIWEALKGIGGAIGKAAAEFFGFDTSGPAAYSGMEYVPATMRATLHQGEAVIPADRNAKRLSGATAPAPAGAAQNYGGGYGGGGGQFEVAVIAEGRLLEAVQLKAESLGRATGMGKRIRKAAGVQVGFSRGDYNPWSR